MASLHVSASRWSNAPAATASCRRGIGGASVDPEDATEGASKVRVEDGIDDRIEETVDVAEPGDQADDRRRDGSTTSRSAERADGG